MTKRQTITIDYDDEMKSTRKLVEGVPLDDTQRRYKPHEKSKSFERLATHVAQLPWWPKTALASDLFGLRPGFKLCIPVSTAELLDSFDKSVEEERASFDNETDAEMQDWTFKFDDLSSTQDRTKVIRSFIKHLVHHRAKLGVYLRLNGIAIPGMYGPSADET